MFYYFRKWEINEAFRKFGFNFPQAYVKQIENLMFSLSYEINIRSIVYKFINL